MARWQNAQILALALLAASAAAQDFPFRNGPLDPSLHSNKIFYNITDVSAMQGVWKGVTDINVPRSGLIALTSAPVEEMCDVVSENGLEYGRMRQFPRTSIILPPENEGEVAFVTDMFVTGTAVNWTAIEYEDGLMRMADDSCLIWRPYFDWEVGKTMMLRNLRLHAWREDGVYRTSDRQLCIKGEVDHPFCSRQRFIIDGQEKDGVVIETISLWECRAGPCLELPFSLPGFVKTQGWQPRD